MTVEEYRKKHKRCRTCKYLKHCFCWYCNAKEKIFNGNPKQSSIKGMFCRVYEPKEIE